MRIGLGSVVRGGLGHPRGGVGNGVENDFSSFSKVLWSICGQSYKHFTIVNYDSRVVIWGIFKSGTTLES